MGKSKFDQDAAFKNLIKPEVEQEKNIGKERPKEKRENKKVRSLSFYPSVYENIQKIAYVERRSTSDIAGELFESYISKNMDKLKEYEELKNK